MKKSIKKKKKVFRVQKLLKKFKWIALFLILVVVGGSILLFKMSDKQSTTTQTPSETASTTPVYPSIAPVSTKNWKTYSNRLLGFTIQYPPDYTIGCGECSEQVDDDVEWTEDISFTPPAPLRRERISLFFSPVNSEDQQVKQESNESVEHYLERRSPTNSHYQEIMSLTKETKVGEYEALQKVLEFGPNIYQVRAQFFHKDTLMTIMFSDVDIEENAQTMKKPIYEYPEIAIYHQMLSTFKPADLPKIRKITSLYKRSTDGSFYVRAKQGGYGHQIMLIDNKGNPLPLETISKEGPFASTRCYECGVLLGEWVNDYQFSVVLQGAFMDANDKLIDSEYEYLINARTGKVELDTFKQIK